MNPNNQSQNEGVLIICYLGATHVIYITWAPCYGCRQHLQCIQSLHIAPQVCPIHSTINYFTLLYHKFRSCIQLPKKKKRYDLVDESVQYIGTHSQISNFRFRHQNRKQDTEKKGEGKFIQVTFSWAAPIPWAGPVLISSRPGPFMGMFI